MKTIFRNISLALVALFTVSTTAMADDDRPIDFSQLPKTAQATVKKHFASSEVLYLTQDGIIFKSYDVVFANGDKIEFDSKGNWKDVDMMSGGCSYRFCSCTNPEFREEKLSRHQDYED